MYEYEKTHSKMLKKKIHNLFNNERLRLGTFDEMNVIGNYTDEVRKQNRALFRQLYSLSDNFIEETIYSCLKRLKKVSDRSELNPFLLAIGFSIEKFKEEYNRTLLFVYENEFLRKQSLYEEGTIAIGNSTSLEMAELQKRNEKSIEAMTREMSADAERKVTLKTFEKDGVDMVLWKAALDDRVCEECEELDGQVFELNELPERPHRNCRCEFVKYELENMEEIDDD